MTRPLALAVLLLSASPAPAAFERLPVGPEAAALGGMLTASPDPVFGNPAPAFRGPALAARGWGGRPFGLPELGEAQVAAAVRRGGGSVGVGFRRFGSAGYAERELRLVVGGASGAGLAAGAALRGLVVAGAGFPPHRSLAVDLGLRFRPDPDAELAAVLEAALGEVPGDPAGRLRRTALGASRRFGSLSIRIEVQRREDGPLGGVVGAAWEPVRALVLRAGARDRAAAWGFGVRLPRIELAASATHAELGRTVRVGVALAGSQP